MNVVLKIDFMHLYKNYDVYSWTIYDRFIQNILWSKNTQVTFNLINEAKIRVQRKFILYLNNSLMTAVCLSCL